MINLGFSSRVRKDKNVGIMKPSFFDRILSFFTKQKTTEKTPPIIMESKISGSQSEDIIYHIKYVQDVLGLTSDGVVGPKTINAISDYLGCDSTIFAIQRNIGVTGDGVIGLETAQSLHVAIKPRMWGDHDGLSQASYNLIIKYEVGGGEGYYNKRLKKPTWPGASSGVTIGIGYDLGYNSKTQFTKDWKKHLSKEDFKSLEGTLKIKGTNAKGLIKGVKHIEIPWEAAEEVFKNSTLPRFMKLTRQAFPGVERLHPDVYGALVSLVFNRGSSMTGNRRSEMRNIRNVIKKSYDDPKIQDKIASEIEQMKRLWEGKGLDGLLTRRDAEASLIRNAV